MTPKVRAAEKADIGQLAAVLADAFFDDPVMEFVVPGGARYFDRLRRLFRMEIDRHVRLSAAWLAEDPAPVSAALWAPPKRWRHTPMEMMRSAIPSLLVFGRSVRRSFQVFQAIENAHPSEPHWYLAVLGTATAAQGRGAGSAVLEPVLERCDREGAPAYLESSKAENVPFYERHGFRVTQDIAAPGGGPVLQAMWRDPQPR